MIINTKSMIIYTLTQRKLSALGENNNWGKFISLYVIREILFAEIGYYISGIYLQGIYYYYHVLGGYLYIYFKYNYFYIIIYVCKIYTRIFKNILL